MLFFGTMNKWKELLLLLFDDELLRTSRISKSSVAVDAMAPRIVVVAEDGSSFVVDEEETIRQALPVDSFRV